MKYSTNKSDCLQYLQLFLMYWTESKHHDRVTGMLEIIQTLQQGTSFSHYTWINDPLVWKASLALGSEPSLSLVEQLLQYCHGSAISERSGINVTYHRIAAMLYWKGT